MIRIPGQSAHLRFFDRVETTDPQYDIVDVGLQYDDGGIDSVAVGGSFYSLKKAIKRVNDNADRSLDASEELAEIEATGLSKLKTEEQSLSVVA